MVKHSSELLEALEESILEALRHSEGKERNDAIANGIKLLAIKNRLRGGDESDYFSSS